MEYLGTLPGVGPGGMAFDASADGSVITGFVGDDLDQKAYRWTVATGMVSLGTIHGSGSLTVARGTTADGSIIVGHDCAALPGGRPCEAFTWSKIEGIAGEGQLTAGATYSQFNAISGDGEVAVGFGDSTLGTEALRWTAAEGIVGLGFAGGAHDISTDGSTIVGHATGSLAGFVWSASTGLTILPKLPGVTAPTSANGVSGDGSVVVGGGTEAFIWTVTAGTRALRDALLATGVTPSVLDGWTLESAESISDDGRTIVGYGTNPNGFREAFIATVPEPSTSLLVGVGLALLGAHRSRRKDMRRAGVLAIATMLLGTPTDAIAGGRPGRVTAIAPVIWACPLEDWAAGTDDRCDPIDTGTAISIIERHIKPGGRHGPFALVEYVVGGEKKRQYVKDINVTPDDEPVPTVESLLQREATRVPKEAAETDRPCAALTGDRAELALLAIIDSRMGDSALHRETRSALSQEEFLSRFFPTTLSEIKPACSRGDEFSAGFALGGDLGLYFGVMHSKR